MCTHFRQHFHCTYSLQKDQPEGSSKTTRKQLFTQADEQTSEENILPTETTGQEDQTMPTPPPQQAFAEPENKPTTRVINKPKYE